MTYINLTDGYYYYLTTTEFLTSFFSSFFKQGTFGIIMVILFIVAIAISTLGFVTKDGKMVRLSLLFTTIMSAFLLLIILTPIGLGTNAPAQDAKYRTSLIQDLGKQNVDYKKFQNAKVIVENDNVKYLLGRAESLVFKNNTVSKIQNVKLSDDAGTLKVDKYVSKDSKTVIVEKNYVLTSVQTVLVFLLGMLAITSILIRRMNYMNR